MADTASVLTANHDNRQNLNSFSAGVHCAWVIARLTLTEALRRRFYLAGLIVCSFYILLGFFPIHFSERRAAMLGPLLKPFVGAVMGTFGSEMIEFFCFLFAVALSAGALSAELDRGTLAVIVPKPLPRWSIFVGKLLGVMLFVVPLLLLLTSLLQWAIWMHIHQTEPSLWGAMGIMILYPLLFSCLTLFFSSFAGNLLATIMPLIMASTAWSEGTLRTLGYLFDIQSLKLASRIVIYIVPLNPMSRWLEKALHFAVFETIPIGRVHPWPADPPANLIDLGWILGYTLGFFIIGLVIFQRRDL